MVIRFYSRLRSQIGIDALDVSGMDFKNLFDIFVWLTKKYPELHNDFFDPGGNLYKDIPIFVNGRNPRLTEAGIHIGLNSQDVISVFTPISSGRLNVEVMREPTYGRME